MNQNRSVLSSIIIGATLMAILSCQHKYDAPRPVNGGPDDTTVITNPADTGICFERDVLPVFISHCAKSGCHDAATREEGYDFSSYATIISKKFVAGNPDKTELYKKITDTDPDDMMPPPPNPSLSAVQKELIRRWIAEGAKNTGNCSTICDTDHYSYSGAIKAIVDKYCIGCHSTATPSKNVILDTYSGIAVVAGDGRLLGALKHLSGYAPMPQGGKKLSDCQIRQVEKWISGGFPDN